MQKYFFIALGGALGSMARYWVESTVDLRLGTRFPYGTFLVNLSACFIIGFSLALLTRRTEMHPAFRYLVAIGFVGAYSTFSTFEWETLANFQTGAALIAIVYVASSVGLGLLAVWLGELSALAF